MEISVSVPEQETPVDVGQILADWIVRRDSERILDPAMGRGALLKCVLSKFESLGVRQGLSRIYGVEVDSRRVRAASRALGGSEKAGPHLFVGDFLLDGKAIDRAGGFDGIICNPPFLRLQGIPQEYRQLLNGGDLADTSGPSGLAGLHVFFVRKALDYARAGGRLAFILPSAAFGASYALPMKLLLRNQTTIAALLTLDSKLDVFPGVMANVSLLLVEKRNHAASHRPLVARLSGIPSPQELRKALRHSSIEKLVRVHRPLQSRLSPAANWANLVTRQPPRRTSFAPLSAIADIRRGIATGCNAFFALSRGAVEGLRLPEISLRRYVPSLGQVGYDIRADDIERMELEGEKTFLLCVAPDQLENPRVRGYVDFGEATGVPEGYLTSHRASWYQLDRIASAPIVFTYMTRARPRFVLNASGALHLNNLIGLYPRKGLSKERLLAILAILNSDPMVGRLAALGREYAGGLLKLEPGDLSKLHVPDPRRLSKNDSRRLAEAFRRLMLLARAGRAAEGLRDLNEVVKNLVLLVR